ncbi:hypothetical protein [Nonomuraea sp. CA-141351]|uniref:hypothetical protein n=1 Tax=Nonomuraea sp. CA-141351 TaxID=3239996 RepID=UPI003D8D551C
MDASASRLARLVRPGGRLVISTWAVTRAPLRIPLNPALAWQVALGSGFRGMLTGPDESARTLSGEARSVDRCRPPGILPCRRARLSMHGRSPVAGSAQSTAIKPRW